MVDENVLLKKLAKMLGNEEVLEHLSQKKEKERSLLESMNRAVNKMSGISEPEVVEQVYIPEEVEEVLEIVEDAKQVEPELPKKTIVTKSVEALSKAKNIEAAADKIPDSYRKELDIIKKSVADFHRFAQRHSQMGGGGAGDILELSIPTKSVTASSYQLGRKDYYVGVNFAGPTTITLPTQNIKNGRQVIVKDESGNCNIYPITINGTTIDNNTTAILAIDNGSLTFIYNNGWRII